MFDEKDPTQADIDYVQPKNPLTALVLHVRTVENTVNFFRAHSILERHDVPERRAEMLREIHKLRRLAGEAIGFLERAEAAE